MIVFPNAKINIGLHIVSRRPDGYHNIETVFYPVHLSDALEMAETGSSGITFSGVPVDGPALDNLVIKAYGLLKNDFQLPPVQFHLHKVIPTGAGLGGGSSDAAFALKMLNNYFDLNLSSEKLTQYAVRLGADCAFFIDNKPAFAKGIGYELHPVDLDLSAYQIVLIKPGVSVSTIQAYKDIVPAMPTFSLEDLIHIPVEKWKDKVVNDFESSIFPQFPEIEKCKNLLYETGALYASMSGSGSAVFGIYRSLPANLEGKFPGNFYFSR